MVTSPDDVYIPVMGLTGSGKSTFIELCAGTPRPLVGHGLNSCKHQRLTLAETRTLLTRLDSHQRGFVAHHYQR